MKDNNDREVKKGMRLPIIKRLMLIAFISITSIDTANTQDVSNLISALGESMFPKNSHEELRTTYYGCITYRDSLILYIRKNQPNIDVSIDLLQKIAVRQNKSDTTELSKMYDLQIRIFKQEWACGLRQFPFCEAVEDQLKLIHAFETALVSFELDRLYPTSQEKIQYWRKASDVFYEKLFKQNPNFEKYHDTSVNNYIRSLSLEDIRHKKDQLIWIQPYYREIQDEKNAFGGISLNWTYITPFIGDIKQSYQNAYNIFQKEGPDTRLEYKLEECFFKQFANKHDFSKLMSTE